MTNAIVKVNGDDVRALSQRIGVTPMGGKMPANVRMQLAHIALLHGLDPLNGEITGIKTKTGWVPYVPLKGAQRTADNQFGYTDEQGRHHSGYHTRLVPLLDWVAEEHFGCPDAATLREFAGLVDGDLVWVCILEIEGKDKPIVELGVVGPSFPQGKSKAPPFKLARARALRAALITACTLPMVDLDAGPPELGAPVEPLTERDQALPVQRSDRTRTKLFKTEEGDVVEGEVSEAPEAPQEAEPPGDTKYNTTIARGAGKAAETPPVRSGRPPVTQADMPGPPSPPEGIEVQLPPWVDRVPIPGYVEKLDQMAYLRFFVWAMLEVDGLRHWRHLHNILVKHKKRWHRGRSGELIEWLKEHLAETEARAATAAADVQDEAERREVAEAHTQQDTLFGLEESEVPF